MASTDRAMCGARVEAYAGAFVNMDRRVKELGLSRYDVTDVLSHPFFRPFVHGRIRYVAFPFRLVEHFWPLAFRRMLGIRPVVVPTAISHLGCAYLGMMLAGHVEYESSVGAMVQQALDLGKRREDTLSWEHPFPSHGSMWKDEAKKQHADVPDSCAHNTVRLGRFLLTAGRQMANDDWVGAACAAARALVRLHNWRRHSDGGWTLSYYPSTDDEVINTAAEVGAFLIDLPGDTWDEDFKDRVNGICLKVLSEMREDGLWNYETATHCRRYGASPTIPDIHHNAMVLSSLARMRSSGRLDAGIADRIDAALERGMEVHILTFVPEVGPLLLYQGKRREASIAGYGETVAMLYSLLGLMMERRPSIERTAVAVIDRALDLLYEPSSGDVASHRRFGRCYNIRSIRWGAGSLMESIATYLADNAPADRRR